MMNNLLTRPLRSIKRILFPLQQDARPQQDVRFLPIYERFKDYTRVPKDYYCLNLLLIERFRHLSGCVVECGVWRGGMVAGIAQLLGTDKKYYLFDSFEGLPEAKEIDGEGALEWQQTNTLDNCRTEEHFAREAMKLSGVPNFKIIKGWFEETLPNFKPEERIAFLRLDADWYSSTAECLNYLYEKVATGGLIIIDDYYAWDGCSRAVHDFISRNRLADRIHQYKDAVCYMVKKADRSVERIDPHGVVPEELS